MGKSNFSYRALGAAIKAAREQAGFETCKALSDAVESAGLHAGRAPANYYIWRLEENGFMAADNNPVSMAKGLQDFFATKDIRVDLEALAREGMQGEEQATGRVRQQNGRRSSR